MRQPLVFLKFTLFLFLALSAKMRTQLIGARRATQGGIGAIPKAFGMH